MSNPTTPFSWQMPENTDLVTDLPADFEVFGQAVATSMADLLGGQSGYILSKTSNTDMDFTWIANDQGDITGVTAGTGISGGGTSGTVTVTNSMATAIDAKGDLVAGTGADAFSRLAVGTNGQVLTANSAAATGLEYTTISAGAYTSLASGSIAALATGVDISSISGAYKDLIFIANGVSVTSSGENCTVRFNNDSGNNYQSAVFDRTNLGGAGLNTENKIAVAFSSVPATTNGQIIVTIPNYTDTTSSQLLNATSYIGGNVYFGIGQWNTNDAVTRIQLLVGAGNFDAGTYELFGVK